MTDDTVAPPPAEQPALQPPPSAAAPPRPVGAKPPPRAKATPRAPKIAELDVLAAVAAMITRLGDAERGRVVAWLMARFEQDLPTLFVPPSSPAPRATVGRPPGKTAAGKRTAKPAKAPRAEAAAAAPAVPAAAIAKVQAALKAKRPKSATEKFLVILAALGDGATTGEVTQAVRAVNLKMDNPAYGGFAAAQQKLAKRSGKSWSLTAAGKKRVAVMK
ncbi:MAG: hypothetical protein HY904_08680 [Deltaproteobacteria bacterium]|nr:hypothetical protein [Deltaproteobacteria bacterium]